MLAREAPRPRARLLRAQPPAPGCTCALHPCPRPQVPAAHARDPDAAPARHATRGSTRSLTVTRALSKPGTRREARSSAVWPEPGSSPRKREEGSGPGGHSCDHLQDAGLSSNCPHTSASCPGPSASPTESQRLFCHHLRHGAVARTKRENRGWQAKRRMATQARGTEPSTHWDARSPSTSR